MKRNQKMFFVLFVVSMFFTAKTYSQQSIVVTGGKGTGTGGTASYSVGQVSDLSLKGSGGSAQEGVQQPYEIATLGIDEFEGINLAMSVFPNPTTDVLNLTLTDGKFENLSCILFDINGKTISKILGIKTTETQVSMNGLSQGVYFLAVSENSKTLKTFKIIKK